jgi:hypothetical protein
MFDLVLLPNRWTDDRVDAHQLSLQLVDMGLSIFERSSE